MRSYNIIFFALVLAFGARVLYQVIFSAIATLFIVTPFFAIMQKKLFIPGCVQGAII